MSNASTLKVSASQIDRAQTCPRSWWLKHVASLPEPLSQNTLLGDIGHGVAERFLTEKPLYPEGWEIQKNRWTNKPTGNGIDPTQQSIVKALIDKGITEGVLTRLPGGEVEHEIKFDVGEVRGVKVKFSGFIDYISPVVGHIQDHKFCGSFSYYGKAKLERAIAMNAYAYAMYLNGTLSEPTVWLRYNLFRKDPENLAVKVVEVERTKEQIEEYWKKQIEPTINDMVLYYQNAKEVNDVPMAEDKMKACNAYGGCPFLSICTGRESCREYKLRLDGSAVEAKQTKQNEVLAGLTGEAETKEKKMSLIDDLKRKKAMANMAAAPVQEAPKPAPVQTKTEELAPVAESLDTTTPAVPWYSSKCPICNNPNLPVKVPGMNGANPCQVCKVLSVREGKPSPDMFNIKVLNDGQVSLSVKGATASPEVPVEVVTPPVIKAPEMEVQKPTPPPVLPKVEKAVEKPIEKAPPSAAPLADTSRKDFAESFYDPDRKGFTMSYHRVQNRKRLSYKFGEANHIVYLGDFMEAVRKEICKAARDGGQPADNYYAISTWTRRDMINANAARWAELLGTSTLEAVNVPKGSDDQVLVHALEAFASVVIGEPSF